MRKRLAASALIASSWLSSIAVGVLVTAAAVASRMVRMPSVRVLRFLYTPRAGEVEEGLRERQDEAIAELCEHAGAMPVRLWWFTGDDQLYSAGACGRRRTHAVWLHPATPRPLNDPRAPVHEQHIRAAILVGGNGQSWCDMLEEAKFLLDQGLYVLALTLSGYPDPDEHYERTSRPQWTPTEATMLADGVTAVRWLTGTLFAACTSEGCEPLEHDRVYCDAPGACHGTKRGLAPHEVLIEGHSLGSAFAHLLGAYYPEVAITAVQPLKSMASAGAFLAINTLADALWKVCPVAGWRKRYVAALRRPVSWAARGVALLAYKGEGLERWESVHRNVDYADPADEWEVGTRMRGLVGFNAERAVAMSVGPYCVIEAAKDNLMALQVDDDAAKPYVDNFGKDLVDAAKTAARELGFDRRVHKIRDQRAEHGTSYWCHKGTREKYAAWLARI